MVDYLAKYGAAVIDHGYDICFIRPGTKRPFGEGWEEKKHGPKTLAAALEKGKGNFGVGIKTRHNPLVDIDCYDEDIVAKMVAFCTELCGETLERVGFAPKTGLLYRSKKPFAKIQSKVFIDDQGRPVKLEVLGAGQQFVALAIHPDTNEPYRWKDKQHPGNTRRASLREVVSDDALEMVDEFERLCRKKGWPEKTGRNNMQGGGLDLDDPFINVKSKVELGTEELRAKLQAAPGAEDYDIWRDVGMALYHQYDGADEGLILWHEWSAQANNYDSDALDAKWPTFDIQGKKREPMTARYIIKLAKEEEERIAFDELEEVKGDIDLAADLPSIRKICERIKRIAFEEMIRESLIPVLRKQIKAVSNTEMSVSTIRRLIRFENPDNRVLPKWLEGYVYCAADEGFYSQKSRMMLSHKAFDAMFGRYAMTRKDRLEGRAAPEHAASHLALHRHEIPTVHTRMYLPGQGDIFEVNGLPYVNAYTEIGIPDTPDELTKKERGAILTVLNHLEHLFDNERDRKLLLSWIAFIVQNPGKRINWAPIIQGVEGDGKTFFHLLIGAVLGGENVKTVPGEALAEKNTAFAEGCQFCLIEEVRLHGQDRYSIVNKVKPYITNVMVPIRRMRTDWYDVLNTVSYILTTNHKDGVPSKKSDRYFPLFSRWQTEFSLAKFNRNNPRYYDELHEALAYPGALRKWLLEYKLHPEFNHQKRATRSSSRDEMEYLNMSEEEEAFETALDESKDRDFCRMLLDSAKVAEAMADLGASAPYGRQLKMMLSEAGFSFIGRAKIKKTTCRLWSQEPERFINSDREIDTAAVRAWLSSSEPEEVDI